MGTPGGAALADSRRAGLGHPHLLLGLIVVFGLILRCADAGAWLSHDEGYSWLVASAGTPGAFLQRLASYENTPPLFYLLMAPLPLDGEVWLRLPSILAGSALSAVLYGAAAPVLGRRAALLAALAVAVAPFAVSYSDYSRGFMVADLGIMAALLAAQRLASGRSRSWWLLYGAASVWALYSEYPAVLTILALTGMLLIIGTPRRRETIVFGLSPLLAMLPWVPQIVRSQDQLGRTKLPLHPVLPTPAVIRDGVVPLIFGEHGAGASATVRDLQALMVAIALLAAILQLRRRASRAAFWLFPGLLLATLVLHLLVSAVDTNVFRERYLTAEIALAAATVAGALATLRTRSVLTVAAGALLLLGLGVAAQRLGRQYEPNAPLAAALARGGGRRTILTNSAVTAFYGRDLHVVVDRPFGIGPGIESSCAPRCAVIDDARAGGVRPGTGVSVAVGPIVVRFPPAERRRPPA